MNAVRFRPVVTAVVVATVLGGCGPARQSSTDSGRPNDSPAVATAAPQPVDTNWRSLIDSSASAWRGYKTNDLPAGWKVVDGTLSKEKAVRDIVTRDQFGNFELTLDWKLSRGGNAGLFYRGTEEYDAVYWSAPEYQLLDDAVHVDRLNPMTSAGAAYDIYPAPAGHAKPGGQWNSTRLVVNGSHVEHWLNGFKLLEYELGGPEWTAKVKASKFSTYPNYGRAARGHIAIQGDHEGALALRNIRIREIAR